MGRSVVVVQHGGKSMTKLQWEFGDTILWVAFGKGKPFPINIFMKNGNIDYRVHPNGTKLSEAQYDMIEQCVQARIAELRRTWNGNMTRRLKWPETPLQG
jgi:hypothetical protein